MTEKKPKPKKDQQSKSDELKFIDQEIVRKEKLEKLASEGIDIFPHKTEKSHSVFEVVSNFASLTKETLEGQKVKVAVPGRILSIRGMGRATFFHISDGQGKLQAYLREDMVGKKNYKLFSLFDIGDIISVEGLLFKTKTGELTIQTQKFSFLAKSLHPLPEKWHGLQDIELRYRKRYLDLIMNPEVRKVFQLRCSMISEIRKFFDQKGYLEVETPMMHSIPGGALARPFKTYHNALGIDLYLRIAPELYLKRLTVGGIEKVYEINRNFRNEGISAEHNPEFTMLEFYEAYSDYHELMELTEDLINSLCQTLLGKEEAIFGKNTISFRRPWKRIKFQEALVQYSGLAPSRFDDQEGIIEIASNLTPEKKVMTYGKALDVIFDKNVKPNIIQPTFVMNPPKIVSPLAKSSKENPDEADRFELVIGGIEIANAFNELADPEEQQRRFEQQATEKKKGVEEAHWIDKDYINALEYGLPPTAGEGIGIDRLAMIFADKKSIREVILFPLLRPKD
jgi:lysyl-tRNA synthetase class 2